MALHDMEVIVYPRHVKKMLTAYLDKKISADDLTIGLVLSASEASTVRQII